MVAASDAGMLSPYRVLDLSDARGLLSSKILADLGADVIQIEPPSGHDARRIGPFYKDEMHPDNSFFWWAYAANKRSVTLDITQGDGQALLKRMVERADFLFETGAPGELQGLGLGYDALSAINPGLIYVSITPFGQDGPYADYKATDLIGMALSGFMYVTGDPDRPPVRVGYPHFYLHGCGAAASGAMVAHMHRVLTGQGQYVDVSCQEAQTRAMANAPQSYAIEGSIIKRQGSYRQTGKDSYMRLTWACKDGYVNFQLSGGQGAGGGVNNFVQWMVEEGMGDAYLESLDFTTLGYGMITSEMLQRIVPPVERFLLSHTKLELLEGAVARRILLFPVATPADIVHDRQLAARHYFQTVEHPDRNETVTFLGPFVQSGEQPLRMRHFPPRAGQHNEEIFVGELGLTSKALRQLRRLGVV